MSDFKRAKITPVVTFAQISKLRENRHSLACKNSVKASQLRLKKTRNKLALANTIRMQNPSLALSTTS